MAAYQTPGATINTMNVVPASQADTTAFDRLQQAFRAGLITQQEATQALGVKPAEMVADRQASELKMAVQPLVAEQTLRSGGLAIRKGEAELAAFEADPTGVRKHIASKLADFGLQPTGDPAVDARTLRAAITGAKMDLEWQDKSIAAAAAGVPPLPGESAKDHVVRAGKEIPGIKAQLEQEGESKKQLLSLNNELIRKGKPPVQTIDEARAAFEAINKEEEVKKQEGKVPTEAESKRSVYLAEIEQSNKALDEIRKAGYKPEDSNWDLYLPTKGAAGDVARRFRSADGNRFMDARDKWIESVLRDRSGAAIADSEYANAARQYFPAPGDSPEALEDKKQLRLRAEAALKASIDNPRLRQFFDASGTQYQQDIATGKVAPVNAPAGAVSPQVKRMTLTDGSVVYGYRNPDGKTITLTDPSGKPLAP